MVQKLLACCCNDYRIALRTMLHKLNISYNDVAQNIFVPSNININGLGVDFYGRDIYGTSNVLETSETEVHFSS